LIYITVIEFNTEWKLVKYKLSKLPLILTGLIGGVVLLVSSGVYAGSTVPEEIQYTLVSYHEDGSDGAKQPSWMGKYGELTNEDVAIDEKSVADWLGRGSSAPGKGIGMGVAPLFDTYGVFRASGNHDKSTYVALGYISDEMTMDEAGTSDNRDNNGFSYGFGVTDSTSNFEYMMSVDEENREVSAIGMSFISKF